MIKTIAAAVLTVWTLGWGLGADRAAAQPGAATEKLLTDAKLEYTKVKDKTGLYKLAIETELGLAFVYVEERSAGKDSKGNPILSAYIYAEVLRTPAEFKPSVAMLTKIADVNDKLHWGNLGLAKNKDGSYTMFRNSCFFLKNLDAELVKDCILMVHGDKFGYKKAFEGFVEGGQ